ncbi:MAG: leucine-rich repeat domain-containing protein [bacterium]
MLAAAASAAGTDGRWPRRTAVTVFTTTRREKHFAVHPGEWILCSSRRGLSIPYLWPDATELRFQKHGACVFRRYRDGTEGALLEVRLGTRTGRPELRSALQAGTDPLTIWCVDERGLQDIPDLPPGRYYALSVPAVTRLQRVARLRPLKALRLSCGDAVADLSPLARLTQLESLTLRCTKAVDLQPLAKLERLEVLHLQLGKGPVDLAPLRALRRLRVLGIHYTEGLTDVSPLASLTGLGVLELTDCWNLRDIAPLASLTRLTWLDLGGCLRLASVAPLARMPHLEHLDLGRCREVEDLGPLAGLGRLEYLDLRGAAKVRDASPLARLGRLRHLDLRDCSQLTDLWPLRKVLSPRTPQVRVDGALRDHLHAVQAAGPSTVTVVMNGGFVTAVEPRLRQAAGADDWVNILGRAVTPPPCGRRVQRLFYPLDGVRPGTVLDFEWKGPAVTVSVDQGPRRLAGIVAVGAQGRAALRQALAGPRRPLVVWADAPALEALPRFPEGAEVTLVATGLAVPLRALAQIRNVSGLHVRSCAQAASDLRAIAHLTSLRTLALPGGPRATSLRHLARLARLESLSLRLSPDIADLSPLAALTRLRSLHLTCGRAPDLSPLARLPHLSELSLAGNINGAPLRGIGDLRMLESLAVEWHGNPADFARLARLTRLRSLHLASCRNVARLEPLRALDRLEVLSLRDCDGVTDIGPVARLPRLDALQLDLCDGVADVDALRTLERRGVRLSLDSYLRRRLDAAGEGGEAQPSIFLAPK